MMIRRIVRAVILTGLALVCGSSTGSAQRSESHLFRMPTTVPAYYPKDYASIVEASKAEKNGIFVYSGMSDLNWNYVLRGFAAKYPWIRVQTNDLGNEIFDRHLQEKADGKPTGDMIVAFGVDKWIDMANRGEVLKYVSAEDGAISDMAKLLPGVYAASADPALIVWNPRHVPPGTKLDTMQAVADLAKQLGPRANGRFISYDVAAGSSLGQFPWMYHEIHKNDAWKVLEALKPPVSKFDVGGTGMLNRLAVGDFDVNYLASGISVYPSVAEPFFRDKTVMNWSFIKDGQPMVVRGMGIMTGTSSPASCKLLIDHILSHEGQVGLGLGGVTPHRKDVRPGEIPIATIEEIAVAVGGMQNMKFTTYDADAPARIKPYVRRWIQLNSTTPAPPAQPAPVPPSDASGVPHRGADEVKKESANEKAPSSMFAYSNMTDPDKGFPVAEKDPTAIVSISLAVAAESDVLVQFTSSVTIDDTKSCPCSLRAFLRADGGTLQAVKRVNVGAPAVVDVLKYLHDRQPLDGSLVFPASAGVHKYELLVEQVTGSNKTIEVNYPNIHAIAFLRK
jgi:iron(III) transport system substrate-binding protein